jgi:hypothetical protein
MPICHAVACPAYPNPNPNPSPNPKRRAQVFICTPCKPSAFFIVNPSVKTITVPILCRAQPDHSKIFPSLPSPSPPRQLLTRIIFPSALTSLNILAHTPGLLLHTRIPQPAINDASPPPLSLDTPGLTLDAVALRGGSQLPLLALSLLRTWREAEVVEDFV